MLAAPGLAGTVGASASTGAAASARAFPAPATGATGAAGLAGGSGASGQPAMPGAVAAPRPAGALVMVAGGDVSFGRRLGQVLLRDPHHDPFAGLSGLLGGADLRFVNLESQLSDQHGETASPRERLVFTGPPEGAEALARAGVDLVSLANNHMWDYGFRAFLETLGNLERVGIARVGAGRSPREFFAPTILDRNGLRVAFIAVTDVWNDGRLQEHAARMHVASADPDLLAHAVRAARRRADVDAVVVSYHGGAEYTEAPLPRTRLIARMAIDAGADAFLGHHPHVIQGIALRRGRPIFYSLGNLVMRPNPREPDTVFGLVARLHLRRGEAPLVEVCPVRGEALGAVALSRDPERGATEAAVRGRLREVQGGTEGAAEVEAFGPDGCAAVREVGGRGEEARGEARRQGGR
ncbi:Hypothetical protein CAP_3690 [Chondromyces apiculatus DSM 436]|uniref:Capsule synthesis protein CapA domain-containing protein n=1 Tax=Chondromyces apiculatus DSM 436 TaxID=1192034 RepID=A0A017T8H3_9BACT|nr:Hypothetical protein CAP_3690 [Chondromyces apiculatus DSM 436]